MIKESTKTFENTNLNIKNNQKNRYNSTHCSTETILLIFSFLQTNITSQMWPAGGKRVLVI